jgi:MFS family permease
MLPPVPSATLTAPHPDVPPSDHRAAVAAGFLGWTLDAFDFFLVVFSLTAIAAEFGRTDAEVAISLTLTLAFRPVGAFIFGLMADRYGRRLPLMLDLVFFSIIEIATGLVHSYTAFLVLRALFGIGMGAEWGVGASLAMEKAPSGRRGILSGLLQEGYAFGYLLAAGCFFLVFPRFGWRPMFFVGGLPALLALYVRFQVKESAVWERTRKTNWRDLFREIASHWRLFLFLTLLMGLMNSTSHGTQDLYPTFLQRDWHFTPQARAALTAFSMVGAIVGGIVTGLVSGPHRPAAGDRRRPHPGRARDPHLGVRAQPRRVVDWSVRDAVHGAGRVGRDSRAHHRAVTRRGPRLPARLRLPVRRLPRERDPAHRSRDREAHELREIDGRHRARRLSARRGRRADGHGKARGKVWMRGGARRPRFARLSSSLQCAGAPPPALRRFAALAKARGLAVSSFF